MQWWVHLPSSVSEPRYIFIIAVQGDDILFLTPASWKAKINFLELSNTARRIWNDFRADIQVVCSRDGKLWHFKHTFTYKFWSIFLCSVIDYRNEVCVSLPMQIENELVLSDFQNWKLQHLWMKWSPYNMSESHISKSLLFWIISMMTIQWKMFEQINASFYHAGL